MAREAAVDGLYHLCYGVATMTGVRAWMAGCTKEELRNNTSVCNEPLASFLRHADWDVLQVLNPGTSPAQPVTQQASTAGMHPAVGTHVSSTGILDAGNKSSVTGSGGGQAAGPSVFSCQKFGCDEKFSSGQERDVHQQGCEGLVNLAGDIEDGDLVETDVESEEKKKKRPGSPTGAKAEESKKPRVEPPANTSVDTPPPPVRVNVRIQNERGGESVVVFNQVQHRMYERLKSDDGRFMERIMSAEYATVQEHFIATLLGKPGTLGPSRWRQTNRRRLLGRRHRIWR